MQDPPDVLFRLRVALRNLPKEPPSKEGEEAQGKPGDRGEEEGQEKSNGREEAKWKGDQAAPGKGAGQAKMTDGTQHTQADEEAEEPRQKLGEAMQARYRDMGERRARCQGERWRN